MERSSPAGHLAFHLLPVEEGPAGKALPFLTFPPLGIESRACLDRISFAPSMNASDACLLVFLKLGFASSRNNRNLARTRYQG
jgi:hypothetical protein